MQSNGPLHQVTLVRGVEETAVNKFGGQRRPQAFLVSDFLLLCLKIVVEDLVVQQTSLVILLVVPDLGLAEMLQHIVLLRKLLHLLVCKLLDQLVQTLRLLCLVCSFFTFILILYLITICNTQTLSMRVELELLALRINFIHFLVCF